MPEGDTIFRTAQVVRSVLVGRRILAARANPGRSWRVPGRLPSVVGSTVTAVEARGKHLLVRFSAGLTLHTHLGMRGSWHRYATGERWRRARSLAAVFLEVDGGVAVCFNPAVLELLSEAQLARHPVLRALGPDLLAESFDAEEAIARLRDSRDRPIDEALLDQRAVAGIGNVYKSELLFLERVHPTRRIGELDDASLRDLLLRGRALLAENVRGGTRVTTGAAARAGAALWVYGRAGRPCRRCGSIILSARHGDTPRTTYWCPRCQPANAGRPLG